MTAFDPELNLVQVYEIGTEARKAFLDDQLKAASRELTRKISSSFVVTV